MPPQPFDIQLETNTERPWVKTVIKVSKIAAISLAAVGIGGMLFVKFNTSAAAEITDKYLRPVFGDRQIIFLESVFFNISDQATKIVYHFKKPLAPQFLNENGQLNIPTNLNLTPLPLNPAFPSLSGEGRWNNIPLNIFPNKSVMAYTFVRPDASRSFAIVSIVKIDTQALSIGSVAGTVEPGGKVGKFGTGRVPKAIVQSGGLVAAFDGGFQYRDGAYGMIVGKNIILPLKTNLGTFMGNSDGTVKIFNYTGQPIPNDALFVRQNGPMLIEGGNITVTDPESQQVWGRIVGTNTFTWRSGIGVTGSGELLFAAGNNLSPQTLAQALKLAGATNAIQLDINPHWVRFNIFNSLGSDQYISQPLNKEMQDGSKEYLKGYQKDFFYIYKK